MSTYTSYEQLIKPSWAPPSWLFGPVWSVLYLIIATTFIYAGILYWNKKISFIVLLPFLLNLFFNLIFTPIQFGLKNNLLASIDILLVLTTIFWFMWAIWPYSRNIVYANIPYLLWVMFASVLQLTITFKNW
jgi:tryptophan-rich sensory protein